MLWHLFKTGLLWQQSRFSGLEQQCYANNSLNTNRICLLEKKTYERINHSLGKEAYFYSHCYQSGFTITDRMQLETAAKYFSILDKTNNNRLVKFILAKKTQPSLDVWVVFTLWFVPSLQEDRTEHHQCVHCSHPDTKPWVQTTARAKILCSKELDSCETGEKSEQPRNCEAAQGNSISKHRTKGSYHCLEWKGL